MATATNIPLTAPSHLKTFQKALESLYGDFARISTPQEWIPPPRSGGHRGRYLWTDAFGVLNLLTLHTELRRICSSPPYDDRFLILARRLVATVHDVLGRTRDGRSRLPGASDTNPLGGGLRIGKIDEHGPDGDGQYHHYLTLWMFALNRMYVASGDYEYNKQAVALAKAIHRPFFVNRSSTRPRMVWKMDVNLQKPLVASEGNLDPLDGYVVFQLLQAAAKQEEDHSDGGVLEDEIGDYLRVIRRKDGRFVTSDPLDLGMSLWTAHWFAEKQEWAATLAEMCFEQIYTLFNTERLLERDIRRRLAFREFGTCLGLRCMAEQISDKEQSVDLKEYADRILESWVPYMERSLSLDVTPQDLRPITRVMYAAAMIPGAFRRGYFGSEPAG